MIRSKENKDSILRNEFIRYLYTQYQRKTPNITPNAYSEILRFAQTPDGIAAFERFKTLDRSSLGLGSPTVTPFKRITL